jgi:predicted nucleic acid-binding protein
MHTTSAVVAEVYTLLRRRAGFPAAMRASAGLLNSSFVTVHFIDPPFDAEIWRKLEALRGLPLSYVDASLIVLGERMRIRRIFTFDEDFRDAGLEVVPGAE